MVKKADGGSRLTVNYKPVNSRTVFDAFPFPKVEDLLAKLANAKFFWAIDFSQFYHQLPLQPSDREKTAFCVFNNLYEFTRCHFGLKSAVAYCSRLLSKVLSGISNVAVYLDDVVVFGVSEEEHNTVLHNVLTRIKDAGLSLNKNKCVFSTRNVSFLGYFVENGTIRPDPSRLEPISSFPLPTSVKALQGFIEMATYYSKYIQNFSEMCRPLYDKGKDFQE